MPKTLEMDEDSAAEELTQRLYDQVGAFVNMFIAANDANEAMGPDIVMSALVDHLGGVIGRVECGHRRAGMLKEVIASLVQNANADVIVSVHDDPGEAAQHALAAMKPQGRA